MKKEDHNAVPDSVLTKEFLSQFKTEDDVSKFLTKLHAQVLEKMLEGEMDVHLGYEKNSIAGNNSGNSRNGKYTKKNASLEHSLINEVVVDKKNYFGLVERYNKYDVFTDYENAKKYLESVCVK